MQLNDSNYMEFYPVKKYFSVMVFSIMLLAEVILYNQLGLVGQTKTDSNGYYSFFGGEVMQIGVIKSNILNNLSENIIGDKTNKTSSSTSNLLSKNKKTSYIASIVKQKQEKEQELEKLKQTQKVHIAELKSSLSDVGHAIKDTIKQIQESNSKEFKGWYSIYSSDENSEISKSTDDLDKNSEISKSTDDLDKNSETAKSTDDLDKNSKTSKSTDDLDKNSKTSKSTDDLDKNNKTSKLTDDLDLSKKMTELIDSLIKSGKFELIDDNPEYKQLCKLADKYQTEIVTYTETSNQQIEDLEKQIEELNQKIQKIQKEKDNDDEQIIDSYA